MTFRIGQKVVCVDDKWTCEYWVSQCPCRPVRNGIYTIRAIDPNHLNGSRLLLEERQNHPALFSDGFYEPQFYSRRFRPLIERKTDISIFTAMLGPREKVMR